MSSYNEYVKDVLVWNRELRDFLETENVQRSEEVWKSLDKFTSLMETVQRKPIDTEELIKIQHKAEELQDEMEGYFQQRE